MDIVSSSKKLSKIIFKVFLTVLHIWDVNDFFLLFPCISLSQLSSLADVMIQRSVACMLGLPDLRGLHTKNAFKNKIKKFTLS